MSNICRWCGAETSDTCHWCGADKHPSRNFCFECFATDEFQSDKCRIRELEQQVAAVTAELDELLEAARMFIQGQCNRVLLERIVRKIDQSAAEEKL